MERLTLPSIDYSSVGVVENMRTGTIAAMLCRLAAYEDTGTAPEEILTPLEMAKLFAALEKLKEYQNAEQEGHLFVLPCKVGDTVYHPSSGKGQVVAGYLRGKRKVFFLVCFDEEEHVYSVDDFGQTVFTSKEDAEKALEVINK